MGVQKGAGGTRRCHLFFGEDEVLHGVDGGVLVKDLKVEVGAFEELVVAGGDGADDIAGLDPVAAAFFAEASRCPGLFVLG